MSFDYAATAANARRLLANFGQPVTLTRQTGGTHDPVTGQTSGETPATYTTDGVLLNYGTKESGELRRAGVDIVSTDRKLICGTFDVEPALSDVITAGGKDWTIMRTKTLDPAGTSVLHEIQLRG